MSQLRELYGFVTEGREGRESAAETGDQGESRDRRQTRSFEQRRQHSDQKAADDIHRQRAKRPGFRMPPQHQHADAVPAQRSGRSATGDGQYRKPDR